MDPVEQIKRFQEFIELNYYPTLLENIRKGKEYLILDFSELSKFDPDLATELLSLPEETIKAAETACKQFDIGEIPKIRVRIKNLPKSVKYMLGDIRSNLLGKFITIEGFLLRKSEVKPRATSARFECPGCGNIMNVLQLGDVFKEPTKCGCGRKGKFIILDKELVDIQSLVVQEKQDELEGNSQPQRIHVLLKEDLILPYNERRLNPGAIVLINGITKEIPIPLRSGEISTNYNMLIEANYIQPVGETFEDIQINPEEEKKIKEVSQNNPLQMLVDATAPTIYGNEILKQSTILQLFGGVRKILQDGREVRGDSHILIIGDPGAAKTALIKSLTKLTPKWQYVSGGGGSSGKGIAAVAVKDELLKAWTLDAGAGVLAHNGVLFFDELDKMVPEERGALHEIMESQSFTVHKAGINATLLARATILAAANPKFGRFDPYDELYKQLNLPPTLINRFDLVFPLRDIPEEVKDDKMARHILKSHRKKLVLESETKNPFLDKSFAKKYIAYARRTIFPEITDAAEEVIHKYYTSLRKQGVFEEGKSMAIPINARYLEGLIRLAESSARVRLSADVTKEDAERAVFIVDSCLKQFGFDPHTGKIDIDRISGVAVPASKKDRFRIIKEIIKNITETTKKNEVKLSDIVFEAEKKEIKSEDTEEIIGLLLRNGDIFEPRPGLIGIIPS